jgi:virginiamycin B lyase
MRGRFTTGALLGALVAGTLVAAAQPASADVGDTTPFELPNGAPAPSAIVSVANGDLWMSPATGTSLTSITTQGVASGHPLPGTFGKGATFGGITQTPDGRIWVSERFSSTLSSVNTAGADFTQIALPKSTDPIALAADASGNVWFVAPLSVRYGRVTPAGAVSIFQPGLSTPADISSGPSGPVLAMIGGNTPGLAKVSAEGTLTRVALPGGVGADSVAVGTDGTMWAATLNGNAVFRVGPDGAASTIALPAKSNPASIAAAPDGSAWVVEVGSKKVARISAGGSLTEFAFPGTPRELTVGADGNVWVTSSTPNPRVVRVLSGITPSNTAPPAIASPAGSANGAGTVLTATNGSWSFQPTTFTQKWQRCTGNDGGTCTDIPGASTPTYTVTDADLGGYLRATVTATNLNGAGTPASSSLLQVAAKPAAPVTPTVPTPVAGGATVTIAPGITAKLAVPSSVPRKAKRTYRVTFTAPQPRGTVRFSLIDKAGTEVYVLSPGSVVTGGKKSATAAVKGRIPRSVAKGSYALRAVYTPSTPQTSTYPIATLSRPIRLR